MNKQDWAIKNTREYYEEQEKYREKMSETRHFWYSAEQAKVLKQQNIFLFGTERLLINQVFVNNELKVFTCQTMGDGHKTNWDDMKLIAKGNDLLIQHGPEKW